MQQGFLRGRESNIQSVQRAVALLRALGEATSELGVADLSRQVHLHKSTVSRILSTLLHSGLVERPIGSDKYRLGYELVRLASHAPQVSDVRVVAHPFLEELASTTQETVHLAVLDGPQVINIEQISGSHLIGDSNWVGRRTPVHCVANGKALIAFRSTRELNRLLPAKLARLTSRTITTKSGLRSDLARVRRMGYATASGEIEAGLNAVAAPIRDREGNVIAAVSVSAPAYRMTRKRMVVLAEQTMVTADRISSRLGYGD